MSRIIIEPTRNNVLARVEVIEISHVDGVYALHCTGDQVDECPEVGFAPGDTWGNGVADAIDAAVLHMGAHELRRCEECGGENSRDDSSLLGWSRLTCQACGHVEDLW